MLSRKNVIFTLLVLTSFIVSSEAQNQELDAGWPTYGGAPGGTKYSTLAQITLKNIDNLEEAWTYNSGDVSDGTDEILPTALEVTPIFVNNMLYLCTPFNRVIALDPASGKQRWSFDPQMELKTSNVGAHLCRGVAFWQSKDEENSPKNCSSRIFLGTGDGRIIAMDADKGDICEGFGTHGQIDLNMLKKTGTGAIGITSPPVVYKNTVITGSMIPSYERVDSPDGIVWAFDAVTGDIKWSWNPVPQHMMNQTGGINVWAPMSVDTEAGLIILPTSSPTPDTFGGNRKEPIPYANAIVALDAITGIPRWHFQTVHHDLWDYDVPAQPTLMTINRNGKPIPAVAQVTKMGLIFILDRRTGEPLFPVEERAVPQSDVAGEASSPTQPFPVLPLPVARQKLPARDVWGLTFWDKSRCRNTINSMRNEGLYTPPSLKGTVQIPSFAGGANWGGAAFDHISNSLVVNVTNVASSVRLFKREEYELHASESTGSGSPMLGTPYVMESKPLLSPLGIPCSPPPWGELVAVDAGTGKLRWRVPLGGIQLSGPISTPGSWGSPNIGGPIITAGGLVFIAATMDNKFRAFSLNTGKQVWSATLTRPGMATPMTFAYGPTRKQYIVIAAGGHPVYQTKVGDAITAYTLK